MKQEHKLVITVSKTELIKKLVLLAKLVDMYTSVDRENRSLVLSTALDKEDRSLDSIILLNKEIADEDSLGWDFIKTEKVNDIELIVK